MMVTFIHFWLRTGHLIMAIMGTIRLDIGMTRGILKHIRFIHLRIR
jgi:hypothetical protein